MPNTQTDSWFHIKQEDLCAAAKALLDSKDAPGWTIMLDKETIGNDYLAARSLLFVAFQLVNVELRSFNSNSDIDSITIREGHDDMWTSGERLRMLRIIAPYVREKSRIEFVTDKGEHWRYLFPADGTMLWQRASIQFDWSVQREINNEG